MRKFDIRKIAYLSVFTALAIIVSILESFIPSIGIPGVKLGLTNIVIIICLYIFGFLPSLIVSILRVIISSIFIGNIFQMGFFMSLCGAIISLIIMFVIKKLCRKFSIIGISIFGSIFHIFGQLIIASIYLGKTFVFYYFPVILFSSLITGIFVGIISKIILKNKYISNLNNKK